MNIFLGSENIISPLGIGIDENFSHALEGKTALKLIKTPFPKIDSLFAAQMNYKSEDGQTKIQWMSNACVAGSLEKINPKSFSEKWLVVLSTTKGDIEYLRDRDIEKASLSHLLNKIKAKLPFTADSKIISCACISGLAASIYAADMIALGRVDHAIVIGADVLSEFTIRGFDSFYALDANQCMPFDKNRKGLNLGEAAASVVLSKDEGIFSQKPMRYKGGATSNDANHISGPSRNGEGLYRAVNKALKLGGTSATKVNYISAHGTGTAYNDDMESMAFSRLGIHHASLNSLKGYYGHTLGASSLVELAMGMHSMRQNVLLKTFGCENPETVKPINVLTKNKQAIVKTMLKTASGFGGCNAAAIIQSYS